MGSSRRFVGSAARRGRRRGWSAGLVFSPFSTDFSGTRGRGSTTDGRTDGRTVASVSIVQHGDCQRSYYVPSACARGLEAERASACRPRQRTLSLRPAARPASPRSYRAAATAIRLPTALFSRSPTKRYVLFLALPLFSRFILLPLVALCLPRSGAFHSLV